MRSISTLFNDAFNLVAQNLNLFIGIYAIPIVVMIIGDQLLLDAERGGTVSGVAFGFAIVTLVVGILGTAALTKAVMNPEETTIGSAYAFARKYFWSYLLVSILAGLAVFGGLLLLVIPAIIFAVWFSLALYVLLAEDTRGIAALKASREYVRGHWWAVFGRFVLFGVMVLVCFFVVMLAAGLIVGAFLPDFSDTLAFFVGYLFNLFLTPFSAAFGYFIYKDLKALKDGSGEAAEVERVQDVAEAV